MSSDPQLDKEREREGLRWNKALGLRNVRVNAHTHLIISINTSCSLNAIRSASTP